MVDIELMEAAFYCWCKHGAFKSFEVRGSVAEGVGGRLPAVSEPGLWLFPLALTHRGVTTPSAKSSLRFLLCSIVKKGSRSHFPVGVQCSGVWSPAANSRALGLAGFWAFCLSELLASGPASRAASEQDLA